MSYQQNQRPGVKKVQQQQQNIQAKRSDDD